MFSVARPSSVIQGLTFRPYFFRLLTALALDHTWRSFSYVWMNVENGIEMRVC